MTIDDISYTDMDTTDKEQPRENDEGVKHGIVALFIFIAILFLMALISYSPDDIASFRTESGEAHYPSNFLGLFGANVIWALLLTFGVGTHVAIGLLLLGAVRRMFCLKLLRKTSWDYLVAIVLAAFATSLFAATWSSLFTGIAAHYNLATLAGGVLGDAICGPNGCLLYVFSKWGISILCVILMVLALGIIVFYDWLLLFKAHRRHAQEGEARKDRRRPKAVADEDAPKPMDDGDYRAPMQQDLPMDIPESPAPRTQAAVSASRPGNASRHPSEDADQPYKLPPTSLLNLPNTDEQTAASAQEIETNQEHLQHTLDSFHIDGAVVNSVPGPQVTLFKIKLANGVKVEIIKNIENNIKMELRASSIRILAPIPGESLVGVEVPNKILKSVPVRTMLEDKQWTQSSFALPILLGKNISGKTICVDLAKAPHLLIAGATGTGKSVCMNLIIMSLLYRHSPETLRLIMVDPKKVEFSIYHELPHLLVPVITENSKVALALKWACTEMDKRYRMLMSVGCRDLKSFNNRPKRDNEPLDEDGNPLPEKLPFIAIIIDELADIMLTSKNEVENSLARIAALARATGIHAILATQRPDVKVITGTIKSNFPVRIAFRVASHIDSQTIIGCKGAEALLGCGDMLYKPDGVTMERIQGGMASDEERNRMVEYITAQCPPPVFDDSILAGDQEGDADSGNSGSSSNSDDAADDKRDLFEQAVEIVFRDRKTSISYIQRRLNIGYNKAATLVERLEDEGIISRRNGTANAEILMTYEEYCEAHGRNADDAMPSEDEIPEDQDI